MTGSGTDVQTTLMAAQHHLSGLVQGVGMRPAIVRLAVELDLCGSVRNSTSGVEIVVEGNPQKVAEFEMRLSNHIPAEAKVESHHSSDAPPSDASSFLIEDSSVDDVSIHTVVPLDIAVCEQCQRDVLDPLNHRYEYPFASCTACGPRYSLIQTVPWDRDCTAMSEFPFCSRCQTEYERPDDRRFHAQTNACSSCGPQTRFDDRLTGNTIQGNEAVSACAAAIRAGKIVALKGIGGYQLVCDATAVHVVELLRRRKQRPRKPFAVMVPHLEDAERLAVLSNTARRELCSPTNPIALFDARAESPVLTESVHPGLKQIGVMLPSSPLHLLLLRAVGRPCVVTSGNGNGEPLQYRDNDARNNLREIADAWLTHNRAILRPVDDSVVRVISNRAVTFRCARGLAPKQLSIETPDSILAVGAHQKVALAISNGHQVVLGPHIGDMQSLASRQRFVDHVTEMQSLYQSSPKYIAHDLHPDLFTTRWASQQTIQTIPVQHHHAHVVSGMVENCWLDREVLGVAFDGTGYGTDGTIWGGEFLLCSATGYRRVARLRPFPLLGGDEAIRDPWRITLALLQETVGSVEAMKQLRRLGTTASGVSLVQAQQFLRMLNRDSNSFPFPYTSSAGRLFDGIAALLFDFVQASYEGEPAMRLEAACDESVLCQYRCDVTTTKSPNDDLLEIDWRPMIRGILRDQSNHVPSATISMKFTRSICLAIADVCSFFPGIPVVLSGGCFQNALLTQGTRDVLKEQKRIIGCHQRIPPNDGGLAVGQLAIAAAQLQKGLL